MGLCNSLNALELRNKSLTCKKSAPFMRNSLQRYGCRIKGGEASDLKQVRLGIDFLKRFLGLRMRSSMPGPESVLFLLGSVAMKRKEYGFPIFQFTFEPILFPDFEMGKIRLARGA
jgi:hypothetical protein